MCGQHLFVDVCLMLPWNQYLLHGICMSCVSKVAALCQGDELPSHFDGIWNVQAAAHICSYVETSSAFHIHGQGRRKETLRLNPDGIYLHFIVMLRGGSGHSDP